MQGDYEWFVEIFSLRRLKEYLKSLTEEGIVIPDYRNCSNLAQFYFEISLKNEEFLTLEKKGWANRPEALANLAATQEVVDRWNEVEKNIPVEEKAKALVKDLNWLSSEYEKYTSRLPQFEPLDHMLQTRDFIHILLKHLNDKQKAVEFEERIKPSDENLKNDYIKDPSRYLGAQKYRNRVYVPSERWWWYIDENLDIPNSSP